MASGLLRFPRLNLAARHIAELRIVGRYGAEARSAVPSEITDRLPGLDAEVFASFTAYTARGNGKTSHSISALLTKPDDSPDELGLGITFTVGAEPGRGGSRLLHRESEFLTRVQSLGPLNWVNATVDFVFRDVDQGQLAIPLPFRLEPVAGSIPQVEIRGLRAVLPASEDAGTPELNMIIDRPLGENIHLSIRFELPSDTMAIQKLPKIALEAATTVARALVRA